MRGRQHGQCQQGDRQHAVPTGRGKRRPPAPRAGPSGNNASERRSPCGRPAASTARPATAWPARSDASEASAANFNNSTHTHGDHAHRADVAVLHDLQHPLPAAGTKNPSAVSDRPSKCRQPEKLSSASTITAAATIGGATRASPQASRRGHAPKQQPDHGKERHAAGQIGLGRAPASRGWAGW